MAQDTVAVEGGTQQVVVQVGSSGRGKTLFIYLLLVCLIVAVIVIFSLQSSHRKYFAAAGGPAEHFRSGDRDADDKIAVIEINGPIMPPFTERALRSIKRAKDDDAVRGVLLAIDSPGGFVADSHQIFHRLRELREETSKPIYVCMKRMAASGGYYISMGCGPEGKIFAEPTTWTGSIGVIIPRYDVSGLADQWNVKTAPLKTGRFKDALSPFREMTAEEKELWGGIVNESFERFLTVIADNRETVRIQESEAEPPDDPHVVPHTWQLVSVKADGDANENLATGRIFPAEEAMKKGLVDEIGFEDDAIAALQKSLGLDSTRVVSYSYPQSLFDMVLGSVQAKSQTGDVVSLSDTVPRAMYYFGWVPPPLPALR